MRIVPEWFDLHIWSLGIVIQHYNEYWLIGLCIGPFHFGLESEETYAE